MDSRQIWTCRKIEELAEAHAEPSDFYYAITYLEGEWDEALLDRAQEWSNDYEDNEPDDALSYETDTSLQGYILRELHAWVYAQVCY